MSTAPQERQPFPTTTKLLSDNARLREENRRLRLYISTLGFSPEEATEYSRAAMKIEQAILAEFPDKFYLELTGRERQLFVALFTRKNSILHFEAAFQSLYAYDEDPPLSGRKIVDQFLFRIRKKLFRHKLPWIIITIWGIGYSLRHWPAASTSEFQIKRTEFFDGSFRNPEQDRHGIPVSSLGKNKPPE